ncbi:MAG: flavin prenyltransferase UbiX [Thermoactinomyces sp.]
MNIRRIVIGMTGASGAPYGLCLLEECLRQGHEVHLMVSEAGWRVLKEEQGWEVRKREQLFYDRYNHLKGTLVYHSLKDIGASIASGSFRTDGMVIIPCSMGTLARIAQGISGNLMERTADVMIKEKKPLIIVPRETPLSAIHLENMSKLAHLGVQVVPAMPAFYHQPQTIEDMVRFVAGKVLDQLHIDHQLYRRWST